MSEDSVQVTEFLTIDLIEDEVLKRETDKYLSPPKRLRSFGQNRTEALFGLRVKTGRGIVRRIQIRMLAKQSATG